MFKNKPPKKGLYFVILLFTLPLSVLLFVFKREIIKITNFFPECVFYQRTGFMCPACGNTRSVIALLNGNILESLRYNAVPTVIVILLIIAYLELFSFSIGCHINFFPRSSLFLYFLLLSAVIYFIIRNFFPI